MPKISNPLQQECSSKKTVVESDDAVQLTNDGQQISKKAVGKIFVVLVALFYDAGFDRWS